MNIIIAMIFFIFTTSIKSLAQPSCADILNSERSFAKLAADKNVQDAFIANMNEESIIQQKGKFVKGMPVYQKLAKDTEGKLIWEPAFAAISGSGDFGFTRGPYLYRIHNKDVESGEFATVWQRKNKGQWKFIIDLGTSSDSLLNQRITGGVVCIQPDLTIKPGDSDTDLLLIDKTFAYAENNSAGNINIHYHQQHYRIASSKDLGMVYGNCESNVTRGGKDSIRPGIYLHVWRKDSNRGWQLLHETIQWQR